MQPGAMLLQLGVRDSVVWGGWAGLELPPRLPLQGGCSTACKIPGWDLRGLCAQWAGEKWGQGQGPPHPAPSSSAEPGCPRSLSLVHKDAGIPT